MPIECLDFGGGFIDDDPAVRDEAVARMGQAIDVAADNGVFLMNGSAGALWVDKCAHPDLTELEFSGNP